MRVNFTIFNIYYPRFIKNVNNKIYVQFIDDRFFSVLKHLLNLFSNQYVFLESSRVVDRKYFESAYPFIWQANCRSKFVSFRIIVRPRLFEKGFFIFKFNSLIFRTSRIISKVMSFVIESEYHRLEIVAVNISLHNGVSGGFKFSLNEVPMALNISFELVCIVLCVFHYWERSVGILVDS